MAPPQCLRVAQALSTHRSWLLAGCLRHHQGTCSWPPRTLRATEARWVIIGKWSSEQQAALLRLRFSRVTLSNSKCVSTQLHPKPQKGDQCVGLGLFTTGLWSSLVYTLLEKMGSFSCLGSWLYIIPFTNSCLHWLTKVDFPHVHRAHFSTTNKSIANTPTAFQSSGTDIFLPTWHYSVTMIFLNPYYVPDNFLDVSNITGKKSGSVGLPL